MVNLNNMGCSLINFKRVHRSCKGDVIGISYWGYTDGVTYYNIKSVSDEDDSMAIDLQSIGKLDKNGSDIYCGDIIKFNDSTVSYSDNGRDSEEVLSIGSVYWNAEECRWDITGRESIELDDLIQNLCISEIIGNVHTTPMILNSATPMIVNSIKVEQQF